MSTTIKYKGSTIATAINQTKTLKTAGKYMEDDVTITDSGGGSAAIIRDTIDAAGGTIREIITDEQINLTTLNVTQNGTYNAPTTPNLIAYDMVVVNVDGGSEVMPTSKKQINFIDYDGTILHSYTSTEWASITSMPENPSHIGLVAQGWNWTKSQIDSQLSDMPNDDIWVGQMYSTSSGDTEIDVSFVDSTRLSPYLSCAVDGTITIDWGDNSTSTLTGTSLDTRKSVQHVYTSAGNYTITVHVESGSWAFYGSSTYTLLNKNSSTSDANRVYSNCVQNVRIGTDTSIGYYAFCYCYSLTSITIPSSVTSIGTYAFYSCRSLTSITIPSGVTSIADGAFYECPSLASIAIPNSVTSMGNAAFSNCYSLASITIPSGVTSIGGYALRGCPSLTSITIPSGMTSISNNMFTGCSSLTSVTIPSTVTSIGDAAFGSCPSLASITIPNNVTSIGKSVFQYCYSLASITIPSGVTSIDNNAFQGCSSLASITIPSTVTSIGDAAFGSCISLASVTMSNDVTSIGKGAFQFCHSLASITIPSGVTSIDNNAFQNCYGIAAYHILPTIPPTLTSTSAFTGIQSDCTIYVPSESLETYKTASNWSDYAKYMAGE